MGRSAFDMLRDRLQAALQAMHASRRLPFLESSLRILPARTSDSETTKSRRRALIRLGLPQERLCRQPIDAAQEHHTGCGSELAPTVLATSLAISLHIV